VIGGLAVLKRPGHCRAEQGERENAGGKESFDPLFHVRPRIDPTIRKMTSLSSPSPCPRIAPSRSGIASSSQITRSPGSLASASTATLPTRSAEAIATNAFGG
jgi:hypothetical protein